MLPSGVAAGSAVKVAVFSNGTVTMQNGRGQNYSAEIISQQMVTLPADVRGPSEATRPTIIRDPPRQHSAVGPVAPPNPYPWMIADEPFLRW